MHCPCIGNTGRPEVLCKDDSHPKLPSPLASGTATEKNKKKEKIYHLRKIRNEFTIRNIRNAGISKASREKTVVRRGKDMGGKEARLCRKGGGG